MGLSIVKPWASIRSAKSIVAPAQVRRAHPVDDDLDAVEVGDDVAVERPLVEEQLVAQAGAATGLHGDPQPQVVAALLLDQGLDLHRGDVGEDDRRSGRWPAPVGAALKWSRAGSPCAGTDECPYRPTLARQAADSQSRWPFDRPSLRPVRRYVLVAGSIARPARAASSRRPSAGRAIASSSQPKCSTSENVSVTPAAAASRRPALTRPATTTHGRPRSRAASGDPGDHLAAQRLVVERALPGDHQVGLVERGVEPDRGA